MSIEVRRGDCFAEYPAGCDRSFQLVIADPPYGGILDAAWDARDRYDDLGALLDRVLVPGGTAYVWGGIGTHGNRPFFKWLSEVEGKTSLRLHNLITWSKRRAYGTQRNYLFTREECAMLVMGDRPRTFNVPYLDELRGYAGFNAKYPARSAYKRRTNVWTDVTELFRGKIHPAEKPALLAEIMIHASSAPGDYILDPFAGSGSTGVAAESVGQRHCVLIESSNCPMHANASAPSSPRPTAR